MNIRRYALIFVGVAVGLGLLSLAVQALFGIDIFNGGMAIIPPMTAAMIEGHRYAMKEKRLPESPDMWRFSRSAALVVLAIAMVATVALSFVVPQMRALMAMRAGGGILMGVVLLQTLLAFLVTRYFLGLGARSALNAAKKKGKSR